MQYLNNQNFTKTIYLYDDNKVRRDANYYVSQIRQFLAVGS